MKTSMPSIVAALLCCASSLSAQVVINEFSASNLNNFLDNNNKTEDWIELYNLSGSTVDIGGMYLTDRPVKPTKWMIPIGTTIAGNGFMRFWCSGRDTVVGTHYHTSFKLSQTSGKDSVALANTAGVIQEKYPLEITLVEHSRCRTVDGAPTWMICTNPSLGSSNDGTSQYNSYAEQPTMSLTAGFYTGSQTLSISTSEPNAAILYTLDGTAPISGSAQYTVPLNISATTIVKAIVMSNDPLVLPGKITSNTYFIDESFSLAVLSVGADQLLDLANDVNNGSEIPVGSMEYFDIKGVRVADSYGDLNRHGQDSWVLDQRSIDWVSRDEMGYSKAIFAPLFHYSTRTEYQRFMMRASGDDNYPSLIAPATTPNGDHTGACHIRDEYVHVLALEGGMKVDVRAVERVIVFLNGQYWGVYGLRERPVDHDFTKEYYDQGKFDIQYLSTWGNTTQEYGGQQAEDDWVLLKDYILNNDMSIPGNYQVAKDNIRLTSLIDYFIVNLNSVAKDWLNYNTGWWRGRDPNGDHKKWGYIVWDMDATWDYYINYTNIPNSSPTAEPCDIDDIADYMDQFFGWTPDVGMHEKIFLKLQDESPEFQQLYYSRQADLQNTVYTCDNMLNTLDSMVATIAPEMPRQIARWGGSMSEWNNNIAILRTFVEQRCLLLDDGMVNCFNVTGPYNLTIDVQPAGTGTVKLNTLKLTSFPWSGNYYGNMDNLIVAKPAGSNSFLHWETKSGNVISPDLDSADASVMMAMADTIVAVFSPLVSVVDPTGGYTFSAYPTVIDEQLNVAYELDKEMDVEISMYSMFGVKVADFSEASGRRMAGAHKETFDIRSMGLSTGLYVLYFRANDHERTTKVFVR